MPLIPKRHPNPCKIESSRLSIKKAEMGYFWALVIDRGCCGREGAERSTRQWSVCVCRVCAGCVHTAAGPLLCFLSLLLDPTFHSHCVTNLQINQPKLKRQDIYTICVGVDQTKTNRAWNRKKRKSREWRLSSIFPKALRICKGPKLL